MKRCICFVASNRQFLFRHFSPAIAAAKAANTEVIAFIPRKAESAESEVDGVRIITSPTIRGDNSPFALIAEAIWYTAALRKVGPSVVVAYSLRMCFVVTLAQMLLSSSRFVYVVTGIGHVGIAASFKARLMRWIIFGALRRASRRRTQFIFENPSDPVAMGVADRGHRLTVLMGAGVDASRFPQTPLPAGPPFRFATVSRLIWSKGIDLAIDAISQLAREGHPVELHIYGAPDVGNPLPLDPNAWKGLPGVHYHGFCDEIAAIWGQYHAAVFTSRGGEGLPRALLEAAACGRPAIVTAVPGCADFVRDGVEGYVVPLDSGPALQEAIVKLTAAPEHLADLGRRARQRLLETSTVQIIQARYEEIFRALLDEAPSSHVVHVVTDLDQGGAQQVLRALLGRDRADRHTVIKLFSGRGLFDDDVARSADGVYSLGLPRTPVAFLLLPFAVVHLIWRIFALRPTVLVGWLYYGALAASLGRLSRRPVIWSFHAADFDLDTSFKPTTRAAIRACRALSASVPAKIHYCSNAARLHHERLGFPAGKSVVIANGVDVDRIRQSAVSPPEQPALANLLKSRDTAPDARLVCCIARCDPQKDHRTLLQAFAKLKASGRSFRLVLAGLGCDAGNPVLAALISEFKLQAEVIPIGVISAAERLIAHCDALVLSSRDGEAMPMVLIEALAVGKPVVATDVGGVRETVGDYGVVVPPRDGDALSRALARVLWQDKGHWTAVAASGSDYVRRSFSLDALACRWQALVRGVANSERSSVKF